MTTNPPRPSWSSQLFHLVFPGAANAENHLEACKDKDSNPIGHLALAALAYIPFIGDRAINFAERHLEGLSSIPRELSSRIDFILKTAAIIDSFKDQPLLESDPSTPEITLQSINAELETILQKQGVIISPKGESEEPLERTTLLLNQMANLIETSQDSKTLKILKNDLDTILAKLPKAEITPTSIETIRNSSPIAVQAHAKSSDHPQFIFMQKIYGDNEIFQTNSNRIIAAAKEMIKKSHNSGELSKLFDDLWVKLPKLRSTVAKSQKTQDPKSFGKPREQADFLITPLSFTQGATVYQEYGKWFASKILERFPFPKDRITLKDTRGPLECKFNLSRPLRASSSSPINSSLLPLNCLPRLTFSLENLLSPDRQLPAYKEMRAIISSLINTNQPMGDFVFGEKTIKIENETIHLSDYIIITNNNKDSATIHYAMQPQQIETTKKIIKTCFTKAILSSNEQELKENLALFRYLIAHATPWERGSAAIAEWMEQAVYQYKGYKACYGDRSNPTQYRLVDLDADVSFSIESYFNDYIENMHLTPIQTS